MLKNKKGFTLVELLAVIVILAIILAIAIPGISGIINSAKKNSFESDAKMIVTGIEYKALESSTDTSVVVPEAGDEITTDMADFGANPDNYDFVCVIDMDHITIQVSSASDSEFGQWYATATKSTVTFTTVPFSNCIAD